MANLRLPVKKPQPISKSFLWIETRRGFIQNKMGATSLFMLPAFALAFLFLTLLLSLLALTSLLFLLFQLLSTLS